jgi:glycosyltransferase involved in cell wall biosynthesis
MDRVVFFSCYTGLGGGETSLLALWQALDPRRYVPILICPREGQLTQAARDLRIKVYVLPYRGASAWFVPSLWRLSPIVRRLGSIMSELAPAVVHSDFHTLPYSIPASRRLKIPLIFGCYGWWFHPKPWQRDFYRAGPERVLAISEAVKRGFLGDPPFMPSERVQVLHLGVDAELFRPRPAEKESIRRELGLDPGAPLVTLLGRFQHVKGQDVFLAAARRVASAYPAARFALGGENVFEGRADEAFKRQIVSTVAADPILHGRVGLLGWVPRSERLIAASDVVVCSSQFESFGMVLIEAMACAVPVVSTNVGGPAETIVDAKTGYLVPPSRSDLLADRILLLLNDQDLRHELGRNGRERILKDFSIARYAAAFSEILVSLATHP